MIYQSSNNNIFTVFEEVGARYPDIQKDRWIVDIGEQHRYA
jgi:hypothetical protein